MSDYINTLNDDCLYAIFNQVPLYDRIADYDSDQPSVRFPVPLFSLDQVCHRWATLLPDACSRRTTLGLTLYGSSDLPIEANRVFEGFPCYPETMMFTDVGNLYYNASQMEKDATLWLPFLLGDANEYRRDDDRDGSLEDTVKLYDSIEDYLTEKARFRHARLDRQLVTYLAGLFPKVHTLAVTHRQCFDAELAPLVDLLGAWPRTLKTLKLWIRTWNIDARYRTKKHPLATQLLPRLNQFDASLEQLTLLITGRVGYELVDHVRIFPVELFSFVSKHRLVKLFLGTYDKGSLAWDIVQRFADTKWCLLGRICNERTFIEVDTLSGALNPQFEFANKVAHFYREKVFFASVEQFGQFCRQFGDLWNLRMDWKRNITYTQLLTNLALLTQLHNLQLSINFREHPANPFALKHRADVNEQGQVQLPQVIWLQFDIDKRSQHDFESFSAFSFPSVKQIIVTANSSIGCNLVESLRAKFGEHFIAQPSSGGTKYLIGRKEDAKRRCGRWRTN